MSSTAWSNQALAGTLPYLYSSKGVSCVFAGEKCCLFIEPCFLLIHTHAELVIVQRFFKPLMSTRSKGKKMNKQLLQVSGCSPFHLPCDRHSFELLPCLLQFCAVFSSSCPGIVVGEGELLSSRKHCYNSRVVTAQLVIKPLVFLLKVLDTCQISSKVIASQ